VGAAAAAVNELGDSFALMRFVGEAVSAAAGTREDAFPEKVAEGSRSMADEPSEIVFRLDKGAVGDTWLEDLSARVDTDTHHVPPEELVVADDASRMVVFGVVGSFVGFCVWSNPLVCLARFSIKMSSKDLTEKVS